MTHPAENDAPAPGRLFEHAYYTTGYQREDGPEPVTFEVTEVAGGRVSYGPAQRGIETTATLWIHEHLFARDALGAWVGARVIPPAMGHSSGGTGHDHMTNAEIQARYASRDTPPAMSDGSA